MKIYNILSKLLQIRKYVFLNIVVILSYTFWICLYLSVEINTRYVNSLPPGVEPDWFGPNTIPLLIALLSAVTILWAYGFAFIEILIRYIFRNKFNKIKSKINFKIPKILNILYYIIFYIGLCLSIIPAIGMMQEFF